jgi:tripartite-type tricarboxylate transporter receptor subunit TctC
MSVTRWIAAPALAALTIVAAGPAPAAAADAGTRDGYPTRPIRFVIPFAPGGGNDILARVISPRLSERLGQPMVLDNRPGAGGSIGTGIVASAPPDGHTILVAPTSHAINPAVFARLPFDTQRDLLAVTLFASTKVVLVVNPSVTANSLKDLVALGKAKPGLLSIGSAGNGTVFHLLAELLKSQAGFDAPHVPFKGGAPAVNAIVGNDINVLFDTGFALSPFLKAGKVRALAVASATRSSILPEVPTMVEAGFPNVLGENWYVIFVPRGTPPRVVQRLNTEVNDAVKRPEIRERIEAMGAEVLGTTPEEARKFVETEVARWAKIARLAGVKPE